MDWMWSHPWICLVIGILLYIIIYKLTRNDQIITANGGQEAEAAPEETAKKKISIFGQDGKLIEELTVNEDDLTEYGDNDGFDIVNKEGKKTTYLTTGLLVKIEEL